MYRIGDVLRGHITGDLYVVENNYRDGSSSLRKLWVNHAKPQVRVSKVGAKTRRNMAYFKATLIGRNYQEKAK